MQRTWDFPTTAGVIGSAACWSAGIVLFLGFPGDRANDTGLLFIIIGACTTVLLTLRSWQFRMHRAFTHGWHAGWHEACKRDCEDGAGCNVLDFAEVQARKLSRLG